MHSYAPKISESIVSLAEQIDRQLIAQKRAARSTPYWRFSSIPGSADGSFGSFNRSRDSIRSKRSLPLFHRFQRADEPSIHYRLGRLRHTTEIVTLISPRSPAPRFWMKPTRFRQPQTLQISRYPGDLRCDRHDSPQPQAEGTVGDECVQAIGSRKTPIGKTERRFMDLQHGCRELDRADLENHPMR